MTEENWRPIPGYEDAYEASDQGRVRSLDRVVMVERKGTLHLRRYKGRILQPHPDPNGYLVVNLCVDGTTLTKRVHPLILLAFVGPRPEGMDIRHLNGIPDDNRLSNLAYGSSSENHLDKVWHGKRKLQPHQIYEIRARLAAGEVQRVIAVDYGVTNVTVCDIKTGRRYGHVQEQR